MARPKTHKISIQTKGLSHEEAAPLYYLVTVNDRGVLKGDSDRHDSASIIPQEVLRAEYPDDTWRSGAAKARIALVS